MPRNNPSKQRGRERQGQNNGSRHKPRTGAEGRRSCGPENEQGREDSYSSGCGVGGAGLKHGQSSLFSVRLSAIVHDTTPSTSPTPARKPQNQTKSAAPGACAGSVTSASDLKASTANHRHTAANTNEKSAASLTEICVENTSLPLAGSAMRRSAPLALHPS